MCNSRRQDPGRVAVMRRQTGKGRRVTYKLLTLGAPDCKNAPESTSETVPSPAGGSQSVNCEQEPLTPGESRRNSSWLPSRWRENHRSQDPSSWCWTHRAGPGAGEVIGDQGKTEQPQARHRPADKRQLSKSLPLSSPPCPTVTENTPAGTLWSHHESRVHESCLPSGLTRYDTVKDSHHCRPAVWPQTTS